MAVRPRRPVLIAPRPPRAVAVASLFCLAAACGGPPARTPDQAAGGPVIAQKSGSSSRAKVAITVYNQNFGLVREVRDVTFTRGVASLEYRDVAQHVQPETVHIRPLAGGLRVLEQNYQFDLLNPQKLLEKYVGRTVTVYRTNPQTGIDEPVTAEVLSVSGEIGRASCRERV